MRRFIVHYLTLYLASFYLFVKYIVTHQRALYDKS